MVIGRVDGGVGAAAGPAALLAGGAVAAFFGAVRADRLGVRRLPDVRPKRGVVGRACEKLVEHVFDVDPDIQVVADRAADERQEVGRSLACRHAADEQPVLAAQGDCFINCSTSLLSIGIRPSAKLSCGGSQWLRR